MIRLAPCHQRLLTVYLQCTGGLQAAMSRCDAIDLNIWNVMFRALIIDVTQLIAFTVARHFDSHFDHSSWFCCREFACE